MRTDSASSHSPFHLFGDGAGHGSEFGLFGQEDEPQPQLAAPQIDLLIATDCISEGQNLQDCATVVNYDIHWNPVRLIQRFGRIDRIGSRHETIQMVNFWPVADLNQYINLQNRVESRMALAVLTSTGDENLLKESHKEIAYRDQQLLRLQEEIVDLEEMSESITLSDFTLEEFRLDLHDFLGEKRAELANAPEGIFAVVPQKVPSEKIAAGYLFCLRHTGGEKSNHYPYAPYYIVYVSADGEAVHAGYMNLKTALDVWRITSAGVLRDDDLCKLFDAQIDDGGNMEPVIPALKKAVRDIRGTANKVNLAAALGGKKMDDIIQADTSELSGYDLVTWLAIV